MGTEEGLVTDTDKKVGIAFAAAIVLIVLFGYTSANGQYPITVPLQAGVLGYPPTLAVPLKIDAIVERAEYRVPGRQMSMRVKVTNNSDSPVQLAEFQAGPIRFLDAAIMKDTTGYPEGLLAEEGLAVEDNSPLAPGETRTYQVTATDAAWENERMTDLIYDPDSRFGGLLKFKDTAGTIQIVEIGGPIIPNFG